MYTSCDISISKDYSYIIMKQSGYINKNIGVAFNIEAHKIARKHGINKFLVDLTETKNLDTFADKYEFAYKDLRNLPEMLKNKIIALVVDPEDHSHDFVGKLSGKMGFNVTIFRNMREAVEYIQSFDLNGKITAKNSSYPEKSETESDYLSEEGVRFLCPLCWNNNFRYNPDNHAMPIVCSECKMSFSEREISELNRENLSLIIENLMGDQLEELPVYENFDELEAL